jgi:selenocysteine lyase/cysteine desulfurase
MNFSLFGSKSSDSGQNTDFKNFDYLDSGVTYMDSACQTLRPQQVIDKETEYYQQYNSCGHRVKYKWGYQTDDQVMETRKEILKLCKKSEKDYIVAFNLNTTAGINQILYQLRADNYKQILVSDIDHSSVFIPSIRWSQINSKERVVLDRVDTPEGFGNLDLSEINTQKAILLTNTHSNIDGRGLGNLAEVVAEIKAGDGLVMLDACQTFGHHPEVLGDVDFDVAFGSGHKMYGPSVGFMVIKRSLALELDYFWLGGSTISDNLKDSYEVVVDPDELYAPLEPGLQNFAGIIGLGEAIRWRNSQKFETLDGVKVGALEYEKSLAEYLQLKLGEAKIEGLYRTSNEATSTVSFWLDKVDSHKLSSILGEMGIYFRTGYHCCYYYLKHKMKYPALARISLGLNNNYSDIDRFVEKLSDVAKLYN